jgi:hypothetical protein
MESVSCPLGSTGSLTKSDDPCFTGSGAYTLKLACGHAFEDGRAVAGKARGEIDGGGASVIAQLI